MEWSLHGKFPDWWPDFDDEDDDYFHFHLVKGEADLNVNLVAIDAPTKAPTKAPTPTKPPTRYEPTPEYKPSDWF